MNDPVVVEQLAKVLVDVARARQACIRDPQFFQLEWTSYYMRRAVNLLQFAVGSVRKVNNGI